MEEEPRPSRPERPAIDRERFRKLISVFGLIDSSIIEKEDREEVQQDSDLEDEDLREPNIPLFNYSKTLTSSMLETQRIIRSSLQIFVKLQKLEPHQTELRIPRCLEMLTQTGFIDAGIPDDSHETFFQAHDKQGILDSIANIRDFSDLQQMKKLTEADENIIMGKELKFRI